MAIQADETPYHFSWPVDQEGYEILPPEISFEEMMKTATSLLGDGRRTVHEIKARGG